MSVASNSVLVGSKLAVGLVTGSVSIISEAAHSGLDLFAAAIAFVSVSVSGRPADREHPYGHGKVENISGAIEALLILVAAAFIVHEAVDKLRNPEPVSHVMLGIYVMGFSILVNVGVSRHLFKVAAESDSIALEADAHHLRTDVWTSTGVLLGMAAIKLTGWYILDPLIAVAVAGMIVRVAFSLTWKAAAPLLDVRLPEDELSEIEKIVMGTPRIVGYHKLRTRKSGPYREIDLHLIVPSKMPVVEAHKIANSIEEQVRSKFANTNVVTHIEPDTAEVVSKPSTEVKRRPRRHLRNRPPNG